MSKTLLHIALLITALTFLSCGRTPRGVMGTDDMAEVIADLKLADAYIDSHPAEFESDSSKQVLKQSIFKKHGIDQSDYDSSLVWYVHNMEDYTRAYDKAVGILKKRYDKLDKKGQDKDNALEREIGEPTHLPVPQAVTEARHRRMQGDDTEADTIDMWQGARSYLLTQGLRRGFITFDLSPENSWQAGDRYQLIYKLLRGGNDFKACLNVDYTDGATSQINRSTNSDGWIIIDVQSDSTRKVSRVYGYVSYDIKHGHVASVDSLMLMRTRLSKSNYGFINAQRLLERKK